MKKIANKSICKPRVIDTTVKKYLSAFGAVCIEEPKWCGKTWTSSFHSSSKFLLSDFANNFQNRLLAEMSPTLVLQGETSRLLDKWQEVLTICDTVRYTVDQRADKGQFILTGSSTPKRKGILHSGVGRIGKLRMRTMSLYESGESSGAVSLEALCNGEVVAAITYEFDADFNSSLQISEDDVKGTDISILNRKVIEKAEKWVKLLSIYLHLQECKYMDL